jgi:hypothetical protein
MLLAFVLALAATSPPPGVVIDHQPASTREYAGSPSLAILPNGDYVSSHDLFGPGSGYHSSALTRVFRSTDRGKTWSKAAELDGQFWSTLFVHRGSLYLMGTDYEYGHIVIRRSIDGGRSWAPASKLTGDTGYHTAPVPIAIKDGRIWRAFEFHPEGPWGFFQAFLMSAALDVDLLSPSSWTRTDRLPFPSAAPEGHTWLEGNAVVDTKGQIVDVLRVDNVEKAAIVTYANGKLVFDQLVDFPGGAKKFTIRYDSKSRRYWTLATPAMPSEPLSKTNPAGVRNTLALLSSNDLYHWQMEHMILSHPDPAKFAFQYVDWQFDKKDIVFVSRTAFSDEDGGPHSAHDANYLTFHRIRNFRQKHHK